MGTINFYELASKNKRRTAFLIISFLILLGLIGYFIDYIFFGGNKPTFIIIALIIAGFQSFLGYYYGDKWVLRAVKARKPDLTYLKEKQYVDVVEELCLAAGLPTPKIYVMDDPSPNAFATGRDPQHASVCVTTGLLEMMNRDEIMGVIAHELSHIRNRDILTMTMVAALAGAIIILADLARWALWWGGGGERKRRRSEGGGGGNLVVFIILLVLIILAPIFGRLLALAVSRSREYLADAGSAELTRNPLALASALEKIATSPPMKRVSDGVAHLFIADPKKKKLSEKDSLWANLWSTHPPIWRRIALLKEMAGQYT